MEQVGLEMEVLGLLGKETLAALDCFLLHIHLEVVEAQVQ
jgi:hypothetical protein